MAQLSSVAVPVARGVGGASKARAKMRPKGRPLEGDFVSDEEFAALLRAWFGQVARVLKPGGSFYIWGGYSNIGNYPPALRECGLYFSQAIIWVKEHPVLTRKDYMGNHEWCFYGWREGAGPQVVRAQQPGLRSHSHGSANGSRACRLRVPKGCDAPLQRGAHNPPDLWHVKKVNPASVVHLTEKPVELAARAIQHSSRPGENVLDLFAGSGSTLPTPSRRRGTAKAGHRLRADGSTGFPHGDRRALL